jgi:hypothetical protein
MVFGRASIEDRIMLDNTTPAPAEPYRRSRSHRPARPRRRQDGEWLFSIRPSLLGLPEDDIDLQLVKGNPWFDIPIAYTNGGRAIVSMEKGPSGDQAFTNSFTAWEK